MDTRLKHFHFWIQQVIPLIYTDDLSVYEVLGKVLEGLNEMVTEINSQGNEIESLKQAISLIQEWIDNYDTSYAESIIRQYLSTMIFVEISQSGYIIYNIPTEWNSIQFNTTGLDISLQLQPQYGHLVLSY